MKVFVTICMVMMLAGCSVDDQSDKGVMPKEKMQLVMWDIIAASSFTDQYIKKDSLKNPALENSKLQQQIFALHHITREDFTKSYNYYLAHPDMMRTILDSITARGDRDRSKMFEKRYNGRDSSQKNLQP